jgi:hypothetical protein
MDDTSRYLRCMEEVRDRLKLVKSVTSRQLTTGREFADVELVFVQLRKILELIAFASLTANKEKYSAAHARFATHWNAKRMLADLEKVNSDFYPMPLGKPQLQADGIKHFPEVSGKFLTKDEFILLYDRCGEILHARNPFTDKPPTIDVLYPVTQWVSLIHTLLDIHLMHLVGGNKWVIFIPDEGEIHLLSAEPRPDG